MWWNRCDLLVENPGRRSTSLRQAQGRPPNPAWKWDEGFQQSRLRFMGVPITYNIRNLVERKATTLMTAVGIGLTVAVLVTALALTEGLKSVFAGSGDPRQVLVLRKGVEAELSSSVSNENYE